MNIEIGFVWISEAIIGMGEVTSKEGEERGE